MPTVSLVASPASIAYGGSSTLSITAGNSTGVTVTGSDGSSYALGATGGSKVVNPTATTTYTAVASGEGGSASAAATVTVGAAPAPTVTVVASPTSILAGGSSTLTVQASNATQVSVAGSDGSTYSLPSSGGTQAVSPKATTTYTVTATGAGGSVTATATINVTVAVPLPTVSISASPAAISAGSSSTLAVAAQNASDVSVAGTDGSTYSLPAVGGTQTVSPATTTTYTVTATGAGGKATSTAVVTVTPNPPPSVTMSASPTSIIAGSSSILTVTALNSTNVTIAGTDGSSYKLASSGGTQAVSPASTTTYTVTANGPGGKATASSIVTVTPNPAPTVQITASPASINAGGSSTLTVTALNAAQVTISGSDGTNYPMPQASGGTQTVTPTVTTTYTVTATGSGGTATANATVTVTANPTPTITIAASPTSVSAGNSSTLTVVATNATQVTVTGTDASSFDLQSSGGTHSVTPTVTTTYTATANGPGGKATAETTVTVTTPGSVQSIDHVIFLLQENRSFDSYFGMLNPYRTANHFSVGDDGNTYQVDGIDDKLTTISNQNDKGTTFPLFKFKSTCIDDDSSDWYASYGDVDRYNFSESRPIRMDGFVHTAQGFATSCTASGNCSGAYTDTIGQRAMGYYDQDFLNYYYYMASQFALSDRWFSPMSSKSVPNRIATFTGGTTQGLVKDPGGNDHLPQLNIDNIFQQLDQAKVSWKIYYTVTQGLCFTAADCLASGGSVYPAIHFSNLTYSYQYIYVPKKGEACTAPTQASSVVGDTSNSYCIDPTHIAPISTYYTDLTNGTLPSFAFIESGSGHNDEHPGSDQSILNGQAQVAKLVNALMGSSAWKDSVFFVSYDEGGGPYDHVPPVPGHSNDNTPTASQSTYPDIRQIAVNPDSYGPCVPTGGTPTLHCDVKAPEPGSTPGDAPAIQGFSAQLGFRVPNMVVSPFAKRHYVSHIPMDHTAVIRFVESRFIGSSAHLTPHDAAEPDLLDFFDFNAVPWSTPPTPPTPASPQSLGYDPCTPANFAP